MKRKRNVLPLIVMAQIAIVVIIFFVMRKSDAVIMYTSDPTEKYILSKAQSKPVDPNLFPVAIYEVQGGKTNFGASGVCYFNAQTQSYRLITMAHVFFRRNREISFLLRKLTPREAKPSWCIEKIVTIGKQWGNNIDIAECDVIPITDRLPIVPCEVDVKPSKVAYTSVYTFEDVAPAGLTNVSKRIVTSLLSNEKVTLCGIVPEVDHESWYYLANYKIIPGESGTGFKDEQGSLYFAEGASALIVTEEVAKTFGLTVQIPGLIFGPLKLRVR